VESLFLASNVAPVVDGFEIGTVREVAELDPAILELELDTAGFTAGFGLDEPENFQINVAQLEKYLKLYGAITH